MPACSFQNMAKKRSTPAKGSFVVQRQQGFTLIEIIVGLVTLGISLVLLSVIIFPQAQRSAEPILQARAAALGQALLDEIMSKSFDENSDRSGGQLRCGEEPPSGEEPPKCTPEDEDEDEDGFGPESGETRDRFNDVDDYHLLAGDSSQLESALGESLATSYSGFEFAIDICYSDSAGECAATNTLFKRVQVTITTPVGQDFQFSAIRGNY